jgi:hypothetical protein
MRQWAFFNFTAICINYCGGIGCTDIEFIFADKSIRNPQGAARFFTGLKSEVAASGRVISRV